eukprot:TRINITY_DN5460_c0_g1_i5.p1 TRINITY_DN5460_c0_g1~~TRINITY_DN5460_c0_g1_i5.p1  ORF type:complete len:323 (+),score=101.43 TRINITY_DN5460_c0_g1_i5:278-1246(+)
MKLEDLKLFLEEKYPSSDIPHFIKSFNKHRLPNIDYYKLRMKKQNTKEITIQPVMEEKVIIEEMIPKLASNNNLLATTPHKKECSCKLNLVPKDSNSWNKEELRAFKVIKTYNNQSKTILSKASKNGVIGSLGNLLGLIKQQAGSLENFLEIWWSNEKLTKETALTLFIDDQKSIDKEAIQQEAEENALVNYINEVNDFYESVSVQLSNMVTQNQYMDIRNVLRFAKYEKRLNLIKFGNGFWETPSLPTYQRVQALKKNGRITTDSPQEYFEKLQKQNNVQLPFKVVNIEEKEGFVERKEYSKEQMLDFSKKTLGVQYVLSS